MIVRFIKWLLGLFGLKIIDINDVQKLLRLSGQTFEEVIKGLESKSEQMQSEADKLDKDGRETRAKAKEKYDEATRAARTQLNRSLEIADDMMQEAFSLTLRKAEMDVLIKRFK